MRLLISGWQGQVARSLGEVATQRADVTAVAIGRPALDLVKLPTILRTLADSKPDIVINTAAYTAVDKAESEPDAAIALNRDGARLIAKAAAERGIPIIHLSTDYVFDGRKATAYVETDPTAPQSVYGRSKLEGEDAVRSGNPQHIIVRTAWVHSPFGQNFVKTMLRLAADRPVIKVVADQTGSPTYAPHLATALLDLASAIMRNGGGNRWGTYHLAGGGAASWCDLAREVFRVSAAAAGPKADVVPITTAEYPTPAVRPANSLLDCRKAKAEFDVALPDWQSGVEACVHRVLKNAA